MNAVEKKSLRRGAAIQILAALAPTVALGDMGRVDYAVAAAVSLANGLITELERREAEEAPVTQPAASVQPVTP